MSAVDFAYAQARMQARHGARPDEASWRRLHASTSLGHFLDVARTTGLAPWVAHLDASQSAHQIERSLRAELESHVAEVASWLPEGWRAALRWTRELGRPGRLDVSGEPWGRRWRDLWPHLRGAERDGLDVFARMVAAHVETMARADVDSDGWLLRAALRASTERLFRKHPAEPVTPFCHLALTALDLERLRGALIRRACLADVSSEVAWV